MDYGLCSLLRFPNDDLLLVPAAVCCFPSQALTKFVKKNAKIEFELPKKAKKDKDEEEEEEKDVKDEL